MKAILTILSVFLFAALLVAGVQAEDQGPKDCTDFAKAAATLGVTEDALKAAMGMGQAPDQKAMDERQKAIAEKLGVTEDQLKSAMESQKQGEKPDDAALAEKLGVSEDKLKAAMGGDKGQDNHMAETAKNLSVTEDALKAALDGAKTC